VLSPSETSPVRYNRSWRDPIVIVAATIILIVELIVVWRALPRALDHDEGEHLRAAAWMASGKTLYRDFVENHTPFLYLILAPLAPDGTQSNDVVATRHYAVVARILSATAGIAAVLFIAACASRLAGDPFAALPVLASLLATSWTWLRGLADVRSEPYTLLLFWAGALLVMCAGSVSRRAILVAGAGIGLIAIADLWNPKWPLESLVFLGLYTAYLYRLRRSGMDILASVAIAGTLPFIALAIALRVTTLRDLEFFCFTYASAISHWYRGAAVAASEFSGAAGGFAFSPSWLMPWVAALAAGVAMVIAMRRRWPQFAVPILLVSASTVEVLLVYPYPHLWPQYLVMWACVVSLLAGVVIAGLAAGRQVRTILAAVIVASFVAHEWKHATTVSGERHWQTMSDLQHRLATGEAAWVRPEVLPTAAPAGSYYWYAFADQVPFSIGYGDSSAAKGFLPSVRDEDLPPCRILSGTDNEHVRLLDGRAVRNLPASKRCMQQLLGQGRLRQIANTPVWEVIR